MINQIFLFLFLSERLILPLFWRSKQRDNFNSASSDSAIFKLYRWKIGGLTSFMRTPFLTIFRRTALGESGVGSKWWGGAKSDGLARRFCLRNQTQAAVLISVMVYSPTFKTICYYFIFPKKCKSVLYFLRQILWGGEGDLMELPKYKIRAGGFPTSANLSMHSSLDLAQTGKPCNFLQNFAKAVHEDWELLKQKQLYF